MDLNTLIYNYINKIINTNTFLEQLKNYYQKNKLILILNDFFINNNKFIFDGDIFYSKFNDFFCNYLNTIDNQELIDFISSFIFCNIAPNIKQNRFNDIIKILINLDKRETMWRFAFSYSSKNIDLYLIEDYFIEKRDTYYITELLNVSDSDYFNIIINKIIYTNDKKFIKHIIEIMNEIPILNNYQVELLKKAILK